MSRFGFAVLGLAALVPCLRAQAVDSKWTVDYETGSTWLARNVVRIPGDTGTKFNFRQLTGSGPFAHHRVTVYYNDPRGFGWRLLVAPLEITSQGSLEQPTSFAGANFAANTATEGLYRFNSYRLSYFNRWKQGPKSKWSFGGTLKVRDAEIRLTQGSLTAKKSDLGVVPLAFLLGEEKLGERWTAQFELDGLFSPMGRAFDGSARLAYAISPRQSVTFGYRLLEGGADNERVYNFFWANYLVLGVQARF
ncbi:MAG: hypothetical protein ACOYON_11485 [Fimbriimonas sp.]